MRRNASTPIELPKVTRKGFTLIELLVVVTIIVVLLALLVPAMDKAIYQAELVQCAGKQKATGAAVVSAAFDYQRRYPDRSRNDWPHEFNPVGAAAALLGTEADRRPALRRYVGNLNVMLQDPFVTPVDLEGAEVASLTFSSYYLWFGWNYTGTDGGPGMMRVGDRWTWRGQRYRALIQDRCMVNATAHEQASHPDSQDVMGMVVNQDTPGPGNQDYTMSFWQSTPAPRRGMVDLNVTYEDLSVLRFDRVAKFDNRTGDQDERMVMVSNLRDGNPGAMLLVPKD